MVKISDIKKVIKWYKFLDQHHLLILEEEAEDDKDVEVEVEETDKK